MADLELILNILEYLQKILINIGKSNFEYFRISTKDLNKYCEIY